MKKWFNKVCFFLILAGSICVAFEDGPLWGEVETKPTGCAAWVLNEYLEATQLRIQIATARIYDREADKLYPQEIIIKGGF